MKNGLNGRTAYTTTSFHVPLSYVIRKDTPNHEDKRKRDIQLIHQSSFVGNMFTRDASKVINILKEMTLDNDSKTWIKDLKCVRKCMQCPQDCYDGKLEGAQRK